MFLLPLAINVTFLVASFSVVWTEQSLMVGYMLGRLLEAVAEF